MMPDLATLVAIFVPIGFLVFVTIFRIKRRCSQQTFDLTLDLAASLSFILIVVFGNATPKMKTTGALLIAFVFIVLQFAREKLADYE